MKLSLIPLMRLGSFRNYPSTYVPTYTPLKSTNLGSQLIVSLVDIFGTKINQIKQQCYFILPIICNDFLKRVKVTAENKQNVPTLYAKITQTSKKVTC